MIRTFRTIILLTAVILISANSMAQPEKRPDNLQQQKMAFFNEKLQLTNEESAKFWPIYNDFQNRRDKITRDRNTLLQYFEANRENMPEAEIKNMIGKFTAFQKEETALLETFTDRLSQVLPSKKVMQVYLVELDFKKWLLDNLRQNKSQLPRN